MSRARSGAAGPPRANIPPRAMASGTKSRSIPMSCGDCRRRRPMARSTTRNTSPPATMMGIANSDPFMSATPSGTSTTATAPSRIPPPKAMTKCRSSCSSQPGRMCSKLATAPPRAMHAPAPPVRTMIIRISDMSPQRTRDGPADHQEPSPELTRAERRASERACEQFDRPVARINLYVHLSVHIIEAALMDAITYTKARATLAQTIDSVCENHKPVIITKKNDRSVVMLSLEDYQALEETAYLLRNP